MNSFVHIILTICNSNFFLFVFYAMFFLVIYYYYLLLLLLVSYTTIDTITPRIRPR